MHNSEKRGAQVVPLPHLLMAEWGVEEEGAYAVTAEVVARYSRNNLPYHNLNHIHATLASATALYTAEEEAADFAAVQLALWFHDIVYNPRATDNEANSAAVAAALLEPLGLSPTALAQVKTLILDTKSHLPTTAEGRLVVDADLAILAAPPAEYDGYAAAIRQEYSWVADDDFRAGRGRVLRGFLARPAIFHTAMLHHTGEMAARANIGRELARLAEVT